MGTETAAGIGQSAGSFASAAAQRVSGDWLAQHSTLIVSVVAVVFSGFIGPWVTGLLSARRERRHDERDLSVKRLEDLRAVLDDSAERLSGAVSQLRPLLAAERDGLELPPEPIEFLSALPSLGHRLRLRLAANDPVVVAFDDAVSSLRAVAGATASQKAFDAAVVEFETVRERFFDASRGTLRGDAFAMLASENSSAVSR